MSGQRRHNVFTSRKIENPAILQILNLRLLSCSGRTIMRDLRISGSRLAVEFPNGANLEG